MKEHTAIVVSGVAVQRFCASNLCVVAITGAFVSGSSTVPERTHGYCCFESSCAKVFGCTNSTIVNVADTASRRIL